MEEGLRRVFGESSTEVVEREIAGEAVRAKARKTETVPSQREAEEHNLDHGVFRSWCPRCVKGRAGSYGHEKKAQSEGDSPTVGLDYMYMHSEQEREEEKGMPIIVAKDNKPKMIMARLAPSKEVDKLCSGDSKEDGGAVGAQEDHHEERQ